MNQKIDTVVSQAEILCALDYIDYLERRLAVAEDAWSEVCVHMSRLQAWLERLAAKMDISEPEH